MTFASEEIQRMPAAKMKAKTHCKYGHPLTPQTTYHRPDGSRECMECRRLSRAKHYGSKHAKHWKRDEVCKNGHPRTPENTGFKIGNKGRKVRFCRVCKKTLPGLSAGEVRTVFESLHDGRLLSEIDKVDRTIKYFKRLRSFAVAHPTIGKRIYDLATKNRLTRSTERHRRLVAAPGVMIDNGAFVLEAVRAACSNVWEPIRDEVMADMIVAATEGKFHPKNARAHVAFYVKKYNQDHRHDVSSRWGNVSLDKPIGDDDRGSFYEIIREDQRLWA